MAETASKTVYERGQGPSGQATVLESGKSLADVAAELGVSPGQLSQWRNEQLAAGSAEALAQKRADEAEMLRLRREAERLKKKT